MNLLATTDWLGLGGFATAIITAVAGAIVTIRHGWAIQENTAKLDGHEDRIAAMEPPEVQRKVHEKRCSSVAHISHAMEVQDRDHAKHR